MHVAGVTVLLTRAARAGLAIELDGRDLKITGPRKAAAIVRELKDRKAEVVAQLRPQRCGALHIQPQHWDHVGGKAYCPRCKRYMGHVISTADKSVIPNVDGERRED